MDSYRTVIQDSYKGQLDLILYDTSTIRYSLREQTVTGLLEYSKSTVKGQLAHSEETFRGQLEDIKNS